MKRQHRRKFQREDLVWKLQLYYVFLLFYDEVTDFITVLKCLNRRELWIQMELRALRSRVGPREPDKNSKTIP